MLRFLFNVILFGLLFYIIHRFLPDTFNTLVSWVDQLYDFLANIATWLVQRVQEAINSGNASS